MTLRPFTAFTAIVVGTMTLAVALGQNGPPERTSPNGTAPAAQRRTPAIADAPATAQWSLGVELHDVPGLLIRHLPQVLGDHPGALVGNATLRNPRPIFVAGDVVLTFGGVDVDGPGAAEILVDRNGPRPVEVLVLRDGVVHRVVAMPVSTRPAMPPVPGPEDPVHSAVAINVSLPEGTVAITGSNGHYRLRANHRGPAGRPVRVDRTGTLAELRPVVDGLPMPLRAIVDEQLRPEGE